MKGFLFYLFSLFSNQLELENLFSGEESYGRFLDFNAIYDQYINLKQFEKIDYSQFVSEFDKFHDITREKKNAEYKK